MKRKPIILLDMDEVLAEFTPAWIKKYNEDYQDNLKMENITAWNLDKLVKPECGYKIYDYFRSPGIYRNLKPIKGSQDAVQDLVNLGAEIIIVTDSPMGCSYGAKNWRGSNPADDKRAWLQEYFPMIRPENFIVTGKKWLIQGDILVDDKPDTINAFQNLGRKIITVDMPYNQGIEAELRAYDWKDIHRLILREWFKGSWSNAEQYAGKSSGYDYSHEFCSLK